MIPDHTHVVATTGEILAVRGFSEDATYAVPIYFPCSSGRRLFRQQYYEKMVDEFAERYEREHPMRVTSSPFGKRVRLFDEDIVVQFDPFSVFARAYAELPALAKLCIDALCRYVRQEDIGYIGSRLLGCADERSDMDIVIRGERNLLRMRRSMSDFARDIGGCVGISHEQFGKSIAKYERCFNKSHNTFARMIANRWPTFCVANKLFAKLRFTYDLASDVIPTIPVAPACISRELTGIVVDSVGTAMMPRRFILEDGGGTHWQVMTYFWDYSYCVADGDTVTVSGSCDEAMKVCIIGDTQHHGIIIHDAAQPLCHVF